MHADGRFGYIDPHQWPQLFSHQYPWSLAIPAQTRYSSPSPMSWALHYPRYSAFELQKDSGVESFNRATFAGLKELFGIIGHDRSRSAGRMSCRTRCGITQ